MRFFENRPLVITLIVALVLVILVVVSPGGDTTTGPADVAGGAVVGSQSIFQRAYSSVGNFFSSIFNPDDMEKENIELKERVAYLEMRQQELAEMERENESLKEILDYKQRNQEYKPIVARVIARDSSYYFDTFTINAGHNDGVSVDDAIITTQGLVGRVVETGGSWSKVMAIIDSQSYVSCTIERTRDKCMVKGGLQLSDETGLCELEYLPPEAALLPGDKVITNDIGSVFPKGLVVGEILQVGNENASTEAGKRTLIKPAVDIMRLEEVMVIIPVDENDQTADDTATPSPSSSAPASASPSPSTSASASPTQTASASPSASASPEDGD